MQRSPTSIITLSISCRNLWNRDTFSKSDPICIVYGRSVGVRVEWEEIGRTEQINDNLNPKFSKQIKVEYHFEEQQELRFFVGDVDPGQIEVLGEAVIKLADIVCAPGQTFDAPLLLYGNSEYDRQMKKGSIRIAAEELNANRAVVSFQLSARNLKNYSVFGKNNCCFVISRTREGGMLDRVLRSPVVRGSVNPRWPVIQVNMNDLCNNDRSRPLVIELYHERSGKEDQYMGMINTTVDDLVAMSGGGRSQSSPIPIMKQKKGTGAPQKRGDLYLEMIKIEPVYTFLDYLAGGCELDLVVAVDFTQSNGLVHEPTSLHFVSDRQTNEYQDAIFRVGSVLQDYDSRKKFAAYGFGAVIPDGSISHCFPLTMNPQDPYCYTIEGVMNAYSSAVRQVKLWGPTLFAPIIRAAASHASSYSSQSNQKYCVLLLMTDGVINDADATIAEVVKASSLPLSIVIVGVGSADFGAMEMLDSDDRLLKDRSGNVAKRDIVQFVPFRQFRPSSGSPAVMAAAANRLAQEVLAEIPEQLIGFMRSRGIVPNERPYIPPPQTPAASINGNVGPANFNHPPGTPSYSPSMVSVSFPQFPPNQGAPPPAGLQIQIPPVI